MSSGKAQKDNKREQREREKKEWKRVRVCERGGTCGLDMSKGCPINVSAAVFSRFRYSCVKERVGEVGEGKSG